MNPPPPPPESLGDPEPPDTNQLTDPALPFATKCDWLPGPPPPPPVSLTVARLGRGPAERAAAVVVESLQAVNSTSADAAHRLAKRAFIGASFGRGSVARASQARVKRALSLRPAPRLPTRAVLPRDRRRRDPELGSGERGAVRNYGSGD